MTGTEKSEPLKNLLSLFSDLNDVSEEKENDEDFDPNNSNRGSSFSDFSSSNKIKDQLENLKELIDKQIENLLSHLQKDINLQFSKGNINLRNKNSQLMITNSLWKIENISEFKGGLGKWNKPIRIRHIASGRYMNVKNIGEVNEYNFFLF